MLTSPRLFQFLKITAPFLVAVWLLGSIISFRGAYNGVVRHVKDEKELFISDFLGHDIDGPFDGQPIAELCARKQWNLGLFLSCDPPAGGFGRVRNAHLNCIRFAIEMGAELIAPRIVKRQDVTIPAPWNGGGPIRGDPIDYFFDLAFLSRSLVQSCPELKLHPSIDDLWDVPSLQQPYPISLAKTHTEFVRGVIINDTSLLADQIRTYVNKVSPPEKRTRPVRFHLAITNWAFPTSPEDIHLTHQFGRILLIRKDIRRLSAAVLFALSRRYHLDIDPHDNLQSHNSNSFVGVHLRTEQDAKYTLPPFDLQAADLLEYLTSSNAKVAYLATGTTQEEVSQLIGMAMEVNVTVVRKEDLLEGEELRALETLTWDQKALVDYGVMLRAGAMAGPGGSSFAWELALRRERAAGGEGAWARNGTGEGVEMTWSDGLSTLFKAEGMGERATMTPIGALWPRPASGRVEWESTRIRPEELEYARILRRPLKVNRRSAGRDVQYKMSAPVDIVTLENVEEKMPRWDPANASHLFALVDMGSNGIRFSISDLSPPRARLLRCVYRERAAISLFDALNKSSEGQPNQPLTFPDETIRLASNTLARFWSIAVDDYGVPPNQVSVFATEAMRRAQNAASMLEAIKKETPDLVVQILAPQVETLFGAVGARSGFTNVKGLFLDLGGGSVQMTYMDTYAAKLNTKTDGGISYEVAAALAGESMPFGAARLIRILETSDSDVRAAEMSKLHLSMGESFQKLRNKFPTLAAAASAALDGDKKTSGIDVYLCGGGFRGYGSMLMHNDPIQPYPIASIGSYVASGKAFGKTKEMSKINKSYDGKIFGMSKRRRAQFPAIVTVVEALIAAVPRIRSVTFCAGGNREGALMMKLTPSIRESDPLACPEIRGMPTMLSPVQDGPGAQHIVDVLISALPQGLEKPGATTVFGLQLGRIYASKIWDGLGADSDANSSAALHDAVTQNLGTPGLTHLGRAVLGLSLCARWGTSLGAIDQQLYRALRAMVDAVDPDALFWASYIGAVSAVLASIVTKWPRHIRTLTESIRQVSCTGLTPLQ
ncbi:Ppx/GppA phosphatase family-domain-containing protein [Podospora aff. communis PSN243]|uniref:Ppx/GppA phosphatase family-domain-containing protein n=1 Tax=Podospora aff. communis PSN243 TaxID=3040156 RepID=A0AAV9H1J5_9PEZI|nr:Ppx/GppA phosphatase family-domain-containing protein [Podospora aff. communis PSN243]